MKKNYIHTTCAILLLGAMAAGLWGCQTDDLAEQAAASQGELQLTVIDNGYTAGQALSCEDGTLRELPRTRATETDYTTTFAAGDKIGLYAMKGSTRAAANLCLTLTDSGDGTLQWQLPSGKKIPADADRYFAYYPYQLSPGNITAAATDADVFFADIISKWKPGADQSTTYRSKDLMVGMGTLTDNQLTIELTHKMGLAVIKLPAGVADVNFYTYIPNTGVSGEYRYLVKPSKETNLSCSFNEGGEMRGFVVAATIAGGNYITYNVSGK